MNIRLTNTGRFLVVGISAAITLFAIYTGPAVAIQCPTGSYAWVDNWGNQICKRFNGGSTAVTEGSIKNCPTGTHSWVDNWGNKICKSFSGNQQLYDTSRGCPVGSYSWVDSWGNPVCKFF